MAMDLGTVRVLDGGWLQVEWEGGQLRARFEPNEDGRLILVALHLEPGKPLDTTLLRKASTTTLEVIANGFARAELLDTLATV